MGEIVHWLAVFLGASPLATVATVFIFDIPRDLLSITGLGLSRLRRSVRETPSGLVSAQSGISDVTVVIPSFNNAEGVLVSLASLRRQRLSPERVIVVCDGSTDRSVAVLSALRDRGDIDMLVVNDRRMGRATAGNIALQYVQSDYVLFIDCDTRLDPEAIAALRARMADRPATAACSGNIMVANHAASLWTGLQQLEYMTAIDFGREFADTFGAVACCSGALTLYRTATFAATGGFSSGSGEDLATTLRLRRAGHEVHFEAAAWAYTNAPETLPGLIRQRLRWDRDAFRIQILQFHQLRKQGAGEPLANTLQRYDYVLFTLVPTLLMPLFLPILTRVPGEQLPAFLAGGYLFLVMIAAITLAPVLIGYRGPVPIFQVLLLPVFPFYQGILMKLVRLYAYLSEAIGHASVHDGYLPARVRQRLNGRH